jgi:hypothetical protein
MSKSNQQQKKKLKVIKSDSGNKISRVMREFQSGRLKTPNGKTVTDHKQALAIALSEAGMSNKTLQKAEIVNKLRVYKNDLENLLKKELNTDKAVKAEILKLFGQDKEIKDVDVHALAERLQISPHDLEEQIYGILRNLLKGGKSGGEKKPVDEGELSMGISVEAEHTQDKEIAEKIARDHLAEDPKYYTKLKEMEAK